MDGWFTKGKHVLKFSAELGTMLQTTQFVISVLQRNALTLFPLLAHYRMDYIAPLFPFREIEYKTMAQSCISFFLHTTELLKFIRLWFGSFQASSYISKNLSIPDSSVWKGLLGKFLF